MDIILNYKRLGVTILKKYVFGFIVLIGCMFISNVVGSEIGRDAGNGEMTSGVFNTGIFELLVSINLLSGIVVFSTFFIIEEIRKNK